MTGLKQRQGLGQQCTIKYSDAVQFLSHVLTSCYGGDYAENSETAMHGLWQAVVSVKSAALQYAPNTITPIWESLTDAQAEWIIVAVVHGCFWSDPPETPRVANGVPGRVDRLKQLGNSVVPQIPEILGRHILEAHHA
jgi:hypothetical protein